MPLTYREAVQVALLLACVPLQYMLSLNMELEESTLGRIMATDFQYLRDNWLSSESWAKAAFDSVQFLLRGIAQPLFLLVMFFFLF